jgi:hypothetical protein
LKSHELAQLKAKKEINKSINSIKTICKDLTSLGGLSFYIYYLHLTRILKHSHDDTLVHMSSNSFDDVCKYLIGCIVSYGKIDEHKAVDIDLTTYLTKLALHINSNYEIISFLSLFDNITLYGERNQYIRIDMSENLHDSKKKHFFEYSHRAQKYIHNGKIDIKDHNEFLSLFRTKFIPYDDLIRKEFGANVDAIICIVDKLLNTIIAKLEVSITKCPKFEDGKIDVQSSITMYTTISNFIFSKELLIKLIDLEGIKLLEKFTFNKNDFDIHQLGYHLVLRQPVIKIKTEYIISPQLLLDSLLVNFHYSLLESKAVKHEYKKRSSDFFLNEIADIGVKHGYKELTRELELYNGKKQLGDIDLLLYNEKNDQYILIEAKNHSLPLDVYFGDMLATERHLKYLQSHWEDKVSKRFQHLKAQYKDYDIGENFKYLIVTKYPEILSHFSAFLVLSLNEFEYFLESVHMQYNFQNIYNNLFANDHFEAEQMKQFTEEFTNFSFAKE